jgi:hypothetical protein
VKKEKKSHETRKNLTLPAPIPIKNDMEGFLINIIFLGWLVTMVLLAIRRI